MNLAHRLQVSAQRFPSLDALIDGDVRITYGQLLSEVERVAANLQRLEVHPADHVLVVLKNRWQNVVTYWACQFLGLIYTPLNFRMATDEVAYCIGDSEPVVVIYEEELRGVVEAAMQRAHNAARAFSVGAVGLDSFEQLRRGTDRLEVPFDAPDDATAIMLYTSGTTGRQKGVPRSHANETTAAIAHIVQNNYAAFESTLGVMPIYHTMGMRSLLSTTFLNGKLALLPDFDRQTALTLLQQERLSCLYLVPTLFYDLLHDPLVDRYDLSALRKIGYAGAAMTSSLTEACFERFHPDVFVNHFGSSEVYTFSICSWLDRKPTCAGRAGLNERIRVVTADPTAQTGPDEPVPQGETGEVIVSLESPEAFRGYWRRDDANRKALRGGWYFTGDVGMQDDEGDLWVLGRVDDMLISGGENIHPLEVEDVLSKHPRVLEVAVAGLPDDRWGQAVTAFVVPADDALTDKDLDAYCVASPALANFKRPRRYVFVRQIPKSPVGKILRRKLVSGEYEPLQ